MERTLLELLSCQEFLPSFTNFTPMRIKNRLWITLRTYRQWRPRKGQQASSRQLVCPFGSRFLPAGCQSRRPLAPATLDACAPKYEDQAYSAVDFFWREFFGQLSNDYVQHCRLPRNLRRRNETPVPKNVIMFDECVHFAYRDTQK